MNHNAPNGSIDIPIQINPCQVENIISPMTKPLITYIIGNSKISEYFSKFEQEPACNYAISYEANFVNKTIDDIIDIKIANSLGGD